MRCPKCGMDNSEKQRYCVDCGAPLTGLSTITETLKIPVEASIRGSLFAERYEIIEELGEGGMGKVFRAFDKRLDEEVALKFIKPEIASDKTILKRFSNELKLARRIVHKNVTRLYEFMEYDGTAFITMEYVQGENLDDLMRKKWRQDLIQTVSLAKQVCDGLAEAHRLEITHRDLKPSNIMIDKEGNVRIMDFGLARSMKETMLTSHGHVIGTPAYRSPEQADGKQVDHRSDIYSLGLILYEMLTGKLPFEADTPLGIAVKQRIESPENPRAYNPQISEDLSELILKCLAREKESRYQNVGEVKAELEKIESSVPAKETKFPQIERVSLRQLTTFLSRKKIFIWVFAVAALLYSIRMGWHLVIQPMKDKVSEMSSAVHGSNNWKSSVAVIPFVDMSSEKNQEYFCDGLTEELIAKLSQIQELKVPARTSAFAFKGTRNDIREVGQQLNVDNVLEGSVRKNGSRLRITAQLIKATDGYHLWSETYDRDLSDIFAVQDEIARSVAGALQVTLLGSKEASKETNSIDAYNSYLLGRYFYGRQTRESLEKAVSYYEQAIKLDAEYARAWAGLGATIAFQAGSGYLTPKEGYVQARSAVEKALSLDLNLAYAHAVKGWIQMSGEWDWTGADASYQKALSLEPRRGRGEAAQLAIALGRFDQGIALARQVAELDPISAQALATLAFALWYGERLEDAIAVYRRILELIPDYPAIHGLIGLVFLTQSNPQAALSELELVKDPYWQLPGLAMAYHSLGRKAESDAALAEYIEKYQDVGAYNIAQVYAFRRAADLSFQWLEKAYVQHDGGMFLLKVDPFLKKLKSDPRYTAFLEKMRLPI